MEHIWGEVTIRTSVQWPFKLTLETVVARLHSLDTAVTLENVDNSGCQDPLIVEYGDPAFAISATANRNEAGNISHENVCKYSQFDSSHKIPMFARLMTIMILTFV
eukprot:TRINITY_DN3036_c1_g1_i1.p2 TRINITY_DN3036_c1_g1~~TRINITY_DN3036_c1_g1_i1.p2  ORF type:complete len:106 (-),score=6.91 TRINITY_DN3036_c1_g1_i1:411-728(-)